MARGYTGIWCYGADNELCLFDTTPKGDKKERVQVGKHTIGFNMKPPSRWNPSFTQMSWTDYSTKHGITIDDVLSALG